MSIECSECERDLRGGHDASCSRYRADFQVPVTYEARGYVTVSAKNADDARKVVRSLMVQMDYEGCGAYTDLMPLTPDLTITGDPVMVEPEDED